MPMLEELVPFRVAGATLPPLGELRVGVLVAFLLSVSLLTIAGGIERAPTSGLTVLAWLGVGPRTIGNEVGGGDILC